MNQIESRIASMNLPPKVKKDLLAFCLELLQFYQEELLSLMVIGSAAGNSYRQKDSDLNLLVVYSDLNIADLAKVAVFARKWMKKSRFAPRFLSRRNLVESAEVFPLDMLEMQARHVLLYGEDLVSARTIEKKALIWQISTELKAMRMRVKQQFWRSTGDPRRMILIIRERFSSLMILGSGLLEVLGEKPGADESGILELFHRCLGVSPDTLGKLASLRSLKTRVPRHTAIALFVQLMEVIRVFDDKAGELRK